MHFRPRATSAQTGCSKYYPLKEGTKAEIMLRQERKQRNHDLQSKTAQL